MPLERIQRFVMLSLGPYLGLLLRLSSLLSFAFRAVSVLKEFTL